MCSTHVGCFCVMIFYYSLLSCVFKLILLAINMHRWRVEGWRKKRCLKAMVGKGKPWVRRWLCLVSVLPLTEGATLSKSLLLFILKREGFPQAWTYNTGKTNKQKKIRAWKTNPWLPWWSSGWESALQCRGHQINSRSRKIPYAAEQLSPCTTTTEALEPMLCNKRSHLNETPLHPKRSTHSPQPRESLCAAPKTHFS